jgi:hypothetical protein
MPYWTSLRNFENVQFEYPNVNIDFDRELYCVDGF